MSKHNILTEEEFQKFSPQEKIIHYIEDYCKKRNLKRQEMNILDWGCGRGQSVLWLREQGYNAFGVDIDIVPIRNGANLFKKKGYDDSILRLLSFESKTNFSNNFFHFIFSYHVFEHVSNIESVACEISRITKKEGIGFHIYPAPKRLVEGHLFMPLVHWFPKNNFRKYLIFIYVLIGLESPWKEIENKNIREKVKVYYQYSINKTFYRKHSVVSNIFQKNGFKVSFENINNERIKNNKLISMLIKINLLRPIFNCLSLAILRQELFIQKL